MRKSIRFFMLALLLAVTGQVTAQKADTYKSLSQPQPTADTSKVEVIEIFWYGCPHCHDFEPFLNEWLENKPDYVEFKRMPAIFRQSWLAHARAFYTAKELDVIDKIHSPLFEAIHTKQKRLDDEESLRKFFMRQGIDGERFAKTYNSQSVDSQIKRSLGMLRRYEVTGVPAVVINGKYLTSGPMAGSYEGMIEIMNQLIEREHAAMQRNAAAATP